ncbi:hypothetical protein ACFL5F_03205 [Planctomycetota bacterium]
MNMKISFSDVLNDTHLVIGVSTIIVLYLVPALVYCIMVPDRILTLAILFMEACFAARVIRSAGMYFLREPVNPWYARSYSLAFMIISAILLNFFVMSVDAALVDIAPVSDNMPSWPRELALISFEFAWFILFDWHTKSTVKSDTSNWTYKRRNLFFRN